VAFPPKIAENDTDNAADLAQNDCFHDELRHNVALSGADCPADANFARRSVTETSMMFMIPIPAASKRSS